MYDPRCKDAWVYGALNRPVNRKAIRRTFRELGWGELARTKRLLIQAGKNLPRPKNSNQFWEFGVFCVWCGWTDGVLLLQRN